MKSDLTKVIEAQKKISKLNDYIFETNFFTQNLETFTALTFLSDGNVIYSPTKLKLFPYFKN